MEPVPAIPVVLAAEYIREFVQQEGGFGGVLCYIGDQNPASFKKGASIRVPEVAYNELGEFYVEVYERDLMSWTPAQVPACGTCWMIRRIVSHGRLHCAAYQ